VEGEQLRRMLVARHPITGQRMGRGFGDSSARAFDATFSASKSISTLWPLSEDPSVRAEVLASHDAAVTAALGWLEDHGSVTRRGREGVDQLGTRGITVALFRQHTSRSIDPQLHTHALIWSKVQHPTGAWLSLDARFLKDQQRSIGWIYDSALRVELTRRLGLAWEPISAFQIEIGGIPDDLRELFSKRSAQVEVRLSQLLRRWVDDHDGAEPPRRTVARLQRLAVLDSRPPKGPSHEGDVLRAEWTQRALVAGMEPPTLSRLARPVQSRWDPEAVVVEAVARVSGQSSSWLAADLAREIATLVPLDAAGDATELVTLVDRLAEQGVRRCVELYPGAARSREVDPAVHVVERKLSTWAILEQESRLLSWAANATGGSRPRQATSDSLDDAQAGAARAVAGDAGLVLVVGPAGTGKTTMLATAVAELGSQGRPVLGLAPSGKAADVLSREARCPALTLAKLLNGTGSMPPAGTTVLLDEAGMASTADLEALVLMVTQHGWRLAAVGDPYQLPAVGRGGMFAHWCDTLPALRLEEVRRFEEA
jgi:conjugative relaxase-like TrwC/TraI family protein